MKGKAGAGGSISGAAGVGLAPQVGEGKRAIYPTCSSTFQCRVVATQSCNMHACLMHLYAHHFHEIARCCSTSPLFLSDLHLTSTAVSPLAVSLPSLPAPTTSCRALPEDQVAAMLAQGLVDAGLLSSATSPFAAAVAGLMKGSCDLVGDGVAQLPPLLGYPLEQTVASEEFKAVSGGSCGCGEGTGCSRGGGGGGRLLLLPPAAA